MNAPIGGAQIAIFRSELDAVAREVARHPRTETGGDLFGSLTHGGLPVVWFASGPGPGAQHKVVEFRQDTAFTSDTQRRLWASHGVQYVGSWHSHHTLGLPHPSGGDVRAVQSYGRRHRRTRSLELLLTLEGGRPTARAFLYPDAREAVNKGFVQLGLRVMPGRSPIRPAPPNQAFAAPSAQEWTLGGPVQARRLILDEPPDTEPMPLSLLRQVERLQAKGVDVEVERRGDHWMLACWLDDHRMVMAVVRAEQRMSLRRARLVEQDTGLRMELVGPNASDTVDLWGLIQRVQSQPGGEKNSAPEAEVK